MASPSRALAAILCLLLLAVPTAAPGEGVPKAAATPADAGHGPHSPYWDRINRTKKIRVAVNTDFPPFAMKDKAGKYFGYDVDLAEMLAEALGVKLEIVDPDWKAIIPGLIEGKYDFIIAAMTRTPERARRVFFSAPYYMASTGVLVEKRLIADSLRDAEMVTDDARGYLDLGHIPGLKVGVKEGTTNEKRVRENLPEAQVVPFHSAIDAARALAKGEVGAVVHDSPFVRSWLVLNPSQSYRIIGLYQSPNRESFGIAMRQSDLVFLEWLNTFVAYLKDSAALDSLNDKYFRRSNWVKRLAK